MNNDLKISDVLYIEFDNELRLLREFKIYPGLTDAAFKMIVKCIIDALESYTDLSYQIAACCVECAEAVYPDDSNKQREEELIGLIEVTALAIHTRLTSTGYYIAGTFPYEFDHIDDDLSRVTLRRTKFATMMTVRPAPYTFKN